MVDLTRFYPEYIQNSGEVSADIKPAQTELNLLTVLRLALSVLQLSPAVIQLHLALPLFWIWMLSVHPLLSSSRVVNVRWCFLVSESLQSLVTVD